MCVDITVAEDKEYYLTFDDDTEFVYEDMPSSPLKSPKIVFSEQEHCLTSVLTIVFDSDENETPEPSREVERPMRPAQTSPCLVCSTCKSEKLSQADI